MKYFFCLLFLIVSCTESSNNLEEKFISTYKEILMVRQTYPDTTIANPKVDSLLKANNYTEEEFRSEMFSLMKDNKELLKVLDSLRNEINKDLRRED